MSRVVFIMALVALVLAAPARADVHGFGMWHAKARQWAWVREAQANVPLPDEHVQIVEDWNLWPVYYAAHPGWLGQERSVIDLPRPGRNGDTYHEEHGLLLHELGHSFDHADLSPLERDRFKAIVGVTCSWWAKRCITHPYWWLPDWTVNLSPGEMFAEEYAACALGLTQEQYQDALYNSYGWRPPAGTDAALCSLIRSSALRTAVPS